MHTASWQFVPSLVAAALVTVVAIPQNLVAQAQQHLVSPSQLENAAVNATRNRQKNLDTLNSFLSSAKARQALQEARIDPQQVKNAVSGLSDEELAQLAARAQKAQSDFAAGNIDNHDLLIILVAIAALILIIVAVH